MFAVQRVGAFVLVIFCLFYFPSVIFSFAFPTFSSRNSILMSMHVVFQRMYLIWFSTKHNVAEDPGSCTSGPVFSGPPWLITVLLRARQLIRC